MALKILWLPMYKDSIIVIYDSSHNISNFIVRCDSKVVIYDYMIGHWLVLGCRYGSVDSLVSSDTSGSSFKSIRQQPNLNIYFLLTVNKNREKGRE